MPTLTALLKEARWLAIHYGHDPLRFNHWDTYSISYCRTCDWPLRIEAGRITAHWVPCAKTSLAGRAQLGRVVSGTSPAIDVVVETHVMGSPLRGA